MTDRQRTFGQFETPADVADLLLGFCLRRPTDRLLDPSCGNGAFLARAAQLQVWMGSEPDSRETLWGVELDPDAAARAQDTLPQAHIINRSFFDLLPWSDQLFEVIIGNPPYTRAEWFGRLRDTEQPARQLSIFDKQARGPSTGRGIKQGARHKVLNRRAGLHAHFLIHGTEFLREGGRLGFVVPNSWLDVAYGSRLKQFLLDHYKILALIESNVERWFSDAKVNTCLVVMEKCSDPAARASNRICLALLHRPLSELIPYATEDDQRLPHLERLTARFLPANDFRGEGFSVRVATQNEMAASNKWGVVLRAPVVFQRRSRDANLHPLHNWAAVHRGYTTGANAFFYLDEAAVDRWSIEPQYRRPLLKSLRHVNGRWVIAADCRHQALVISSTADLSDTAVAEYIAWGEKQGLHRRRTCASRQPWYSLPEQAGAPLLLAKGIWGRHFAPLLKDQILVDQQLYQVHLAEGIPPLAAAALLNSSWFGLQLELHGRVNFGEGVLWLAAYELENVLLPDPRYLPAEQLNELVTSFDTLLEESVQSVQNELAQPAWRALNATVFEILGFSYSEGAAVTDALLERMMTRHAKATTHI